MRSSLLRIAALGLALLAAGLLAACGGETETTTVERTVTETAPTVTETVTAPTRTTGPGPGGGELSDLPQCSEGPPPCLENGQLVEP